MGRFFHFVWRSLNSGLSAVCWPWKRRDAQTIAVIGTGYVGLVLGACFAGRGHRVICVDIVAEKISALIRGEVPFHEPGLRELVNKNLKEGTQSFTTDLAAAVQESSVIFIAVGTPQGGANGKADTAHVLKAAKSIAKAMNGPKVVVLKSTVPVGAADQTQKVMEAATTYPFAVVSNPEFLKEGAALEDFNRPARVVLGSADPMAIALLKEIYRPFVRRKSHILVMDNRSAEMAKYACNALLAMKISFMNELSRLCEKTGADIEQVRQVMAMDPRIGPHFIFPGVGYGGSCFPKDIRALISMGEPDLEMPLLKSVDSVNERQKRVLVEKVKSHFGSDLSGRTFAILGYAFKPETSDARETPARTMVDELLKAGANVSVYDPAAMEEARKDFADRIRYATGPYDALQGVDGLLLVTPWKVFSQLDFRRVANLLKSPVIFDGRNVYDPTEMRSRGFTYYGIGRGRESRQRDVCEPARAPRQGNAARDVGLVKEAS